MQSLLRLAAAALVLACLPTLPAAEDETVDPMPEESMAEMAPGELSQAINEVAKSVPAPDSKPVADSPTARSLRIGLRQADLRAAVDAHDVAAMDKAIDRLLALSDGETGPRVQRRRTRLMELARQQKWTQAQALVSHMIRDRRGHYQSQHGADQTTFVVLGAWLRFAQFGGTARCGGAAERPGPLVKPAMTAKLTERIGKLEAAAKADLLAQRALEAQAKIAPLVAPANGGPITKAQACQVKDLAGAALAGL